MWLPRARGAGAGESGSSFRYMKCLKLDGQAGRLHCECCKCH